MLFSFCKRQIWLESARARGRSTTFGFFPSCFKLRVVQALTKKAANEGKRGRRLSASLITGRGSTQVLSYV